MCFVTMNSTLYFSTVTGIVPKENLAEGYEKEIWRIGVKKMRKGSEVSREGATKDYTEIYFCKSRFLMTKVSLLDKNLRTKLRFHYLPHWNVN